MGKWLSALKWLVVAVVLAVFIGLLIKWNRKGGISVEAGFDDRIELTSQEIRRIEQIGQWEFLSVQSEVVADTLRKGFFTDDRLVAVYTGVPRIGIDMNRVAGEWARRDLYDRAYGKMLRQCLTPSNMRRAETNARNQFTALFRALGFHTVEIYFIR